MKYMKHIPMQQMVAQSNRRQFILQSPNAYDKTVAYITAMLKELKDPCGDVKALVLAPTNERVRKIAGIIREKAPGYRTVEICDGTYLYDERKAFSPVPDIAVATPRQLLEHKVHQNIDIKQVTVLVYDDYDKSLELGFHDVICAVVSCTPLRSTIVLTSTAPVDNLPKVINIDNADVYRHTPAIKPDTDNQSYPIKSCKSKKHTSKTHPISLSTQHSSPHISPAPTPTQSPKPPPVNPLRATLTRRNVFNRKIISAETALLSRYIA